MVVTVAKQPIPSPQDAVETAVQVVIMGMAATAVKVVRVLVLLKLVLMVVLAVMLVLEELTAAKAVKAVLVFNTVSVLLRVTRYLMALMAFQDYPFHQRRLQLLASEFKIILFGNLTLQALYF